ncbi:MAG: YheT family hydrolase [Bacteriovoracales bacterium]
MANGGVLLPIIQSTYKSPGFLANGHLQTIYPFLFRRIKGVTYKRERIATPDEDFLDLDWSKLQSSDSLLILSHGLEGSSKRNYILGMVKLFNQNKIDCLAWNYRSCSGDMNKKKIFYHHGMIEDLETVIQHVLALKKYKKIFLVGFSLGGNITCNYLGKKGKNLPQEIKGASVFSTPFDLFSATKFFHKRKFNKVYIYRFLRSLKKKIMMRDELLVDLKLNEFKIRKIKDFHQWDELITAPLHGFKNKNEYYKKSCSKTILGKIKIPTLLVNAKNDPFLGPGCFPIQEALENPNIFLEIPEGGGHCGFTSFENKPFYWSEIRTLDFFNSFSLPD